MGAKRGRGRGGFIDSVLDLLDTFYGDVVQYLKAWSAAPPRMREVEVVPTEEPASVASTAISSQDGAESSDEGPAGGPDEDGHPSELSSVLGNDQDDFPAH